MKNRRSVMLYILGGTLILLGFLSSFFFILVSQRSQLENSKNAITIKGPTKTDIYLSAEGNYEITFTSIIIGNYSEAEMNLIKDLKINVVNTINNEIISFKTVDKKDDDYIKASWNFFIETPGTYTLDINYPGSNGPKIDLTISLNNSSSIMNTGLFVSVSLFAVGVVLVIMTAIKENKPGSGKIKDKDDTLLRYL